MLDKSRHHIIGTGRWGTWLARRLQATGHEIITVRNRTGSSAKKLAKELKVTWTSNLSDYKDFHEGDILWFCVPDAEISALHETLGDVSDKTSVVHCSGTSPMLNAATAGVFWPIQSITAETEPVWSNLPIIIQASSPAFAKTLVRIASEVSTLRPKVVASNKDRMRMHLGAVMTQNFSNLLWTLTEEVLAKADLDYKELLPLAQNHLRKLETQSPQVLQTGPAKRGDTNTIDAHLALLKGHEDATEIYTLLSEQILGKKD